MNFLTPTLWEAVWGEAHTFAGDRWDASLHKDSIHRLDFRYNDKKRGIKLFIAPVALITAGTILHFSTNAKENFQEWVQIKLFLLGPR
jgi:hypothetical protein